MSNDWLSVTIASLIVRNLYLYIFVKKKFILPKNLQKGNSVIHNYDENLKIRILFISMSSSLL